MVNNNICIILLILDKILIALDGPYQHFCHFIIKLSDKRINHELSDSMYEIQLNWPFWSKSYWQQYYSCRSNFSLLYVKDSYFKSHVESLIIETLLLFSLDHICKSQDNER